MQTTQPGIMVAFIVLISFVLIHLCNELGQLPKKGPRGDKQELSLAETNVLCLYAIRFSQTDETTFIVRDSIKYNLCENRVFDIKTVCRSI